MELKFTRRAAYTQSNSDYYARKFTKIETSGSKITWNWPAFFFGSYWLIYRKMYIPWAIVAALELLIIPAASNLIEAFSSLNLVLSILMGMFGNYIYMNHVDRLIDKEPAGDMAALSEYQTKNGGTTYFVWIYLGAVAVLTSLFSFIG